MNKINDINMFPYCIIAVLCQYCIVYIVDNPEYEEKGIFSVKKKQKICRKYQTNKIPWFHFQLINLTENFFKRRIIENLNHTYFSKTKELVDYYFWAVPLCAHLKFQNRERGIEFCRSRKIISVGCLRRDWQLVRS